MSWKYSSKKKHLLKEILMNNKLRTSQEIMNEYANLCSELGQLVYRLEAAKADKDKYLAKIDSLGVEHQEAIQREAVAKAALEVKPEVKTEAKAGE